jgi:hypothetical protein
MRRGFFKSSRRKEGAGFVTDEQRRNLEKGDTVIFLLREAALLYPFNKNRMCSLLRGLH